MARGTVTSRLKMLPQGPTEFTLPWGFVPRSYEREVFVAYERGIRRFVLCWHRRSGKDRTCLALTTVAMADRPGLYLHVYPTMELARKALWIAQSKEGQPFLDAFPASWIDGEPNKTEMLIKVKPLPGQPAGSIWKLAGADDPDSLRGLNPIGVVLSEYSEHDKRVWEEIISPILNENGGWVIFNFTPKGKNHAHAIYQTALQHPDRWFCSLKTVADTRRDAPGEDRTPVVPMAVIAQERAEGRPEEIIQQESFCSFDGLLRGSIFGDCLRQARADGRIGAVPFETTLPVGVSLDFGLDGTAVVFYQVAGLQVCVIDYFSCRGKGSDYVTHRLKEGKPYLYGRMVLPFDADHDRFIQSETTREVFERLWPGCVTLLDRVSIQAGIDASRRVFPKLYFDEVKCSREQEDGMPSLLDCLGGYRYGFDEKKQENTGQPIHDQFSHGASAFRYAALDGFTKPEWPGDEWTEPKPPELYFNPLTYQKTSGQIAVFGGR